MAQKASEAIYEQECMSVQVSTPIYRDKGIFYKDSGCTQPFTDQEAARVLWRQKHGDGFVDVLKRWATGFVVLFLIGACIRFWDFSEEQGWRYHDEFTNVVSAGWATNEYKECGTAKVSEGIWMICDGGDEQSPVKVFKVRFYGKMIYDTKLTPDRYQWRCRKNDADPAMTCERVKETK
jgi:hypothetical protein